MVNIINETFNDEFTAEEKKLLTRVTEKYDFEIYNFTKVRSAYKLETDKGTICLKKNNHGSHKASNGNLLVKELIANNFTNVAKYISTKEGHLLVTANKSFFYATEWINGEECDLSSITEVENCSKLLAQFHLATRKIDASKFIIRNNLKNWPKSFKKNLDDLQKFKRIIQKKKVKSKFDNIYLNNIEGYYNRGMSILKLLKESEYQKLSTIANENKTICHDSFYYQNIIKMQDKYYMIDLDSIMIDLQVNDLGKFIRRLMYKSEYKWDFTKASLIMKAYESINKLTRSEHVVMLALILFPHKFWKLGKKKYTRNKSWDESKYLHKVKKLLKYNEAEERFLNEYLEYINNNFNENKVVKF